MINLLVETNVPRYEALAVEVEQFLAQAIPAVEKVTGLTTPSTVSMRLVSLEEFAMAWSAFIRRQLERDTKDLDLNEWERWRVAALPKGSADAARRLGLREESLLVATSSGQPSTLIVPEALDHLGLNTRELLGEVLVRALAQQCQVVACDATLIPAPEWPPRSHARDVITIFSEGHARWASDQATPLILDQPLDRLRPRRQRRSALEAVIDLVDIPRRRRLGLATTFVNEAMQVVGLEAFNHVWSTPGLAPTLDELRRPADWIKRLPC